MSKDQTNVVAVVGTCSVERFRLAVRISRESDHEYVQAHQLAEALGPRPAGDHGRPADATGVVVDVPAAGPGADLLTTLIDGDRGTRLEEVICVIDAEAGLEELFREDALPPRTAPGSALMSRPLAAMAQLELASTLVVVNWEDLPTEELQPLLAMVHHLCPHGRIRLQEPDAVEVPAHASYGTEVVRPGWAHLLGGAFEAFVTHERISAFRYECLRPFHPGRLHDLVHDLMAPGRFGTLVRSAGYCRLATSPNVTGSWNHVGPVLSLTPAAMDEDLDHLTNPWADPGPMALGQDLAFIGLDLDRDALAAALDAAVLTDAEFIAGPSAWREQLKPYL